MHYLLALVGWHVIVVVLCHGGIASQWHHIVVVPHCGDITSWLALCCSGVASWCCCLQAMLSLQVSVCMPAHLRMGHGGPGANWTACSCWWHGVPLPLRCRVIVVHCCCVNPVLFHMAMGVLFLFKGLMEGCCWCLWFTGGGTCCCCSSVMLRGWCCSLSAMHVPMCIAGGVHPM